MRESGEAGGWVEEGSERPLGVKGAVMNACLLVRGQACVVPRHAAFAFPVSAVHMELSLFKP